MNSAIDKENKQKIIASETSEMQLFYILMLTNNIQVLIVYHDI
jgi:hypothetical protein